MPETLDQQRRRLRAAIDAVGGLETMIKLGRTRGSAPGTIAGMMQILEPSSPETIDLLTGLAMLHQGLGHDTEETWCRRATDYLRTLIGEPPAPDPHAVN